MTSLRRGGKGGAFTLLLVYLALLTALQIWSGHNNLTGWSAYSVLAPMAASALLTMRATLVVGLLTIVSVIIAYGGSIPGLSSGTRGVIVSSAACSTVLGLVICRIRLNREARVSRLTIARERLTLLRVASRHVGSTLDVRRTAREVTEIAVPGFADLVTVDLYESVLRGEEPAAPDGNPLRRVAQRSVADEEPAGEGAGDGAGDGADGQQEEQKQQEEQAEQEKQERTDGKEAYEGGAPGHRLAQGPDVRARILDDSDVGTWLAANPRYAAQATAGTGRSGIAVPLRARGTTLGVAVFVRHLRADPFDADDLLLAEEIGAQAAVCVDNARRYTHEHRASLTLQQSLLPRRLPEVAAVEVATRYLPADSSAGVGGDWFDVIQLSGARVALVVGDVVGHGLYASATMGRLRSAVRTLADIDLAPDELLTHLDDVVIRLRSETEGGEQEGEAQENPAGAVGATCLYAVYDPVSRTCSMARAGHPAPALVRPDGRVEFIDAPPGQPLGLGGLPFEAHEVLLPEGSYLALYTNGLIARDRDMERGQATLRQALSQPAHSAEAACDAVLAAMLDGGPTDDIALLVARTRALDAAHVASWHIPDDPTAVAHARELAERQLTSWGLEEATFTMELVVSELVTNAIRHADGPIQLRLIREPAALICEVSDNSSTSPHLRRARVFDESGRGLFIVAHLTARWGTRHGREGKTIWAELSSSPSPEGLLAAG
ncbi:ATP-binding SpoIIE family protein phosphatase [Streptomyces johnsoniae]|uniref:SpoIIE family protein phosphatase n=1 Tax=Streptomyces johnsoniae TaxID=3075532 RepID=A0ABU2S5B2_9ACTN|nr:SpoIIE family protein phosphatase [Streptomyces sp. DSM 41886]MDT0443270.1 SpoIIE family protein phosphatase [Streptomyces sp. DSM 41886]